MRAAPRSPTPWYEWLPPDISLVTVLGLLGASFLGSFMTIAFGIGGGVTLLAILATLLPPAALSRSTASCRSARTSGAPLVMLRHVAWEFFPPFLVGSLVGVLLGGTVAVSLPEAAVQVCVGVFILWSVFFTPPALMRRFAWATGAISRS